MRNRNQSRVQNSSRLNRKFGKLVQCLCSGEQSRSADEMIPSPDSLATKDYSASAYSSQATGENHRKPDTGSIEEAELSLRESGSLNYEEARALLGRYEYQKGNIEAALHVFEGIDIATVTPKIKNSLAKIGEPRKRRSHNYAIPPLSAHALSLLLEAIYLKSKSLQVLGRYKEAAQSCKVILDVVESSLPDGLPENFGADCKLQETLNKAVELLPELWQLADSPQEAILSFRRALLHHWNLDEETIAKIGKDFAVFLLYSGGKDAIPPNLRSQMDSSFVPRNNIEEAILLLMILLKKINLKKIEWDPSVIDHLSYALSISGGLGALGKQLEELLPAVIDRKERYFLLSLCYYGEGDGLSALNLLRNIYKHDDPNYVPALLMASKICGENPDFVEEGVNLAKRTIHLGNKCNAMVGVAYSLLGISLLEHSRSALTDSERVDQQSEAIQCLETAGRLTRMVDSRIVYCLSLENAEQRKLDTALGLAKRLIKLEGGSRLRSWLLLARILSGQKLFSDAETIVNAGLDQSGKWDQGELLRTKAKLQLAQGQVKNAIHTYTQLLAVLQVQNKSFRTRTRSKNLEVGGKHDKDLELETWHDLAMVYISLSQWLDAEACLSKSEAIDYYSSSRWHITGLLYEAKGLTREALKAYQNSLDIDPGHVQSLVSMALVLRRVGGKSGPAIRSFLTEALRLDRMNSSAWYNLGHFYKDEGPMFIKEAADCFEAATILEETEPVEPFR
ncbi:protein NPGR2-like [Cynara cardunculus var. scolymus]|uniref:protein NPGR2-like n=1 Tax=Cynara cardunculus var. scolymus TaxID=59895 RepID=UPI000D623608|nr:protein NPGR2-like [Cynara cardunculus var. scolymus]